MAGTVQFEWDDAKAASNLVKHGISFEEATAVFADGHIVDFDASHASDREDRRKAVGRIGLHLITVVYTMRGLSVRLISARRSNPPEERLYDDR